MRQSLASATCTRTSNALPVNPVRPHPLSILSTAWLLLAAGHACAGNPDATVPGPISLPYPTLRHLSIEWAIEGDADGDGRVDVRFRELGAGDWRAAMPLRRVPAGSNEGFAWANRHSGSVFGLEPGTSYELELSLVDPDGGSSQALRSATTRSLPVPMPGAPLRPATPATLAALLATAQAGDIIVLGEGNYAGFSLGVDGAEGAPLVLRGTPGAVISGELGLFFRSHVMLQDLTVEGRIRFNGSHDISITGCRINATAERQGDGIVSFLRAERAYIADNIVSGLTPWVEASLGADGDNLGEGILVTGPGHVIERNRVLGFRDAISFMEDGAAVDQFSIDVLDNDIDIAADDGIEADFCAHNCRIVGNRLVNTFIAFSAQPSLGGPTYFVRNQAFNVVHVPFKLYRGSIGDVVLHNTVVKQGDALNAYPGRPISRAWFRNNLFLGGEFASFNGYASGVGRVIDLQTLQLADSSLDYNGYGTTLEQFEGRLGPVAFSGLAQLRALTSEAHAQQVAFDVFEAGVASPSAPLLPYALPDLSIAAGSAALDAGAAIPNINDDHAGAAPDLGALERRTEDPDSAVFLDGFEAPPGSGQTPGPNGLARWTVRPHHSVNAA